jgi:hypothetical protein
MKQRKPVIQKRIVFFLVYSCVWLNLLWSVLIQYTRVLHLPHSFKNCIYELIKWCDSCSSIDRHDNRCLPSKHWFTRAFELCNLCLIILARLWWIICVKNGIIMHVRGRDKTKYDELESFHEGDTSLTFMQLCLIPNLN